MKVRIYDSCEDYYFISEVLAIINIGYYEKYLVMDSKADNRLKLIDFLDKKVKTDSYPTNVNIISDLILGKEVFSRDISFLNNLKSSDIEGWSYLRSQNDIDDLMKRFHGFHDSVLVDASYTSNLFDASIILKDETIYFFTAYVKEVDESFNGTWIKSLEVRWRYV